VDFVGEGLAPEILDGNVGGRGLLMGRDCRRVLRIFPGGLGLFSCREKQFGGASSSAKKNGGGATGSGPFCFFFLAGSLIIQKFSALQQGRGLTEFDEF